MSKVHVVAHVLDFVNGSRVVSPHGFRDSEESAKSLGGELHANLSAVVGSGVITLQTATGPTQVPVRQFLSALGISGVSVSLAQVEVAGTLVAPPSKIVLAH